LSHTLDWFLMIIQSSGHIVFLVKFPIELYITTIDEEWGLINSILVLWQIFDEIYIYRKELKYKMHDFLSQFAVTVLLFEHSEALVKTASLSWLLLGDDPVLIWAYYFDEFSNSYYITTTWWRLRIKQTMSMHPFP
jgi:hypothetical protein